jgi:hypothetical protein
MDKIIGIGGTGCAIADRFKQYTQYQVFKIDVGLNGDNCFSIPSFNTPEDYERYNYILPDNFKNISGDVLVILSGTGKASGSTLKILYELKHCNLNVLYIKPDNIMSQTAKLQGRLTMGVLQEYARSGIFKRIFLVDNQKLDAIIGDVPIIGYYDVLNELVVNTLHQINKSQHIKPVVNQSSDSKIGCRIYTIGLFSIDKGVESLFFDLKDISEKCYYFHFNKDALKSDGTLLKKIRDAVRSQTSDSLKTGFAIYSTDFTASYCFVTACTSVVQSS